MFVTVCLIVHIKVAGHISHLELMCFLRAKNDSYILQYHLHNLLCVLIKFC